MVDISEEELLLLDETKSIQWNYVNRVEKELAMNSDYEAITVNPLLPRSYKEVVSILAKACDHSRVALLIDDEEEYVAFMLVVSESYVPFILEELDAVETPTRCIYKVYVNDDLAVSSPEDGLLRDFMGDTVIPDLNNDLESWKSFRYTL